MLQHTLIFGFDQEMTDADLDGFLHDVEATIRETGTLLGFSAARSLRLPGDDHAPVFIATAIAQMTFADVDALNIAFAAPGLPSLIERWNARFPYRTVWANHAPLTPGFIVRRPQEG